MARHANMNWDLPEIVNNATTWESLHAAILMDIRDELQRLNALLRCPNFLEIPHMLRTVASNTRKPKRKKQKVVTK